MKSPMRYSRKNVNVPGIEGVRCGPSRRWDQRPESVRWVKDRRPGSRGCAPAPQMWPRSRWLTSIHHSWRPNASGASIRGWVCWWKLVLVQGYWPVSNIQCDPSGRRTKAAGSSKQDQTTGTPSSTKKKQSTTYPPPFFYFFVAWQKIYIIQKKHTKKNDVVRIRFGFNTFIQLRNIFTLAIESTFWLCYENKQINDENWITADIINMYKCIFLSFVFPPCQ